MRVRADVVVAALLLGMVFGSSGLAQSSATRAFDLADVRPSTRSISHRHQRSHVSRWAVRSATRDDAVVDQHGCTAFRPRR